MQQEMHARARQGHSMLLTVSELERRITPAMRLTQVIPNICWVQ